jgi:hypothetical protein
MGSLIFQQSALNFGQQLFEFNFVLASASALNS